MSNMPMLDTNSPAKKILVVAPAWIGDMIMSNTLLHILKQQDPNTIIDVLAPPTTAALISRMSHVRHVILLPVTHKELKLKARYQLAKKLRTEQYEQAIILPNTLKSALIPWLAGIPQRTGWLGEKRYLLLNDIRHAPKRFPRLVQRYAALAFAAPLKNHSDIPFEIVEHLPDPELTVDLKNQQHLQHTFKLSTTQPILALCPGAEYGSAKRWPVEHFAKLAQLTLSMGWHVILVGSPKDVALGAEINQQARQCCIDLTGKTSLLDAIDVLSLAHAVVSNDSGLMHIAAALQKPLIAIYGSSSPTYTPPLDKNSKILYLGIRCSPCFKRECPLLGDDYLRCLLDITPKKVAHALRDILP